MKTRAHSKHQSGLVLLMLILIISIIATSLFVHQLNSNSLKSKQDMATAAALAEAKKSLIAYATAIQLSSSASTRPGDLPCPDINNNGISDTPCSGSAIGRFPWKTIGTHMFTDGNGDTLWYAVSANFKNNPRSAILNSDTSGTITVRYSDASIINNGSDNTAAIAVIFSPGTPITRGDNVVQARNAAGINNPINYLDIAFGEDNATFNDNTTNGFIRGDVYVGNGTNGQLILNDKLVIVNYDDLMPNMENRVGREVLHCLQDYAANNLNRYPWPALTSDTYLYADSVANKMGRIPDTPFNSTSFSSGSNSSGGSNMANAWGDCTIASNSGWWLNWKQQVFYAIADNYKPNSTLAVSCGTTCLNVITNKGIKNNQRVVVMVAGKTLTSQNRSLSGPTQIQNYLETPNVLGGPSFLKSTKSTVFNDTVICPDC